MKSEENKYASLAFCKGSSLLGVLATHREVYKASAWRRNSWKTQGLLLKRQAHSPLLSGVVVVDIVINGGLLLGTCYRDLIL